MRETGENRYGDNRAAIVAVGDELLAGKHPDLNSAVIAARLYARGWTVDAVHVMPDDEPALGRRLSELCQSHELVVVTGGLGPTLDDVTRHAAADAAGVALERDDAAIEKVRSWFEARGAKMPACNERQALFPAGATVLDNEVGTAPGFRVAVGPAQLAALPGPPSEMLHMLEGELLPWLDARPERGASYETAGLHLFGLSESVFAERAGDWMARDANPCMGVSVKAGVLSISLRARDRDPARARELVRARRDEAAERFAKHVFDQDEPDLARVVGERAIATDVSLALAESCTGGRIADRLTGVAGVSAVFREGFVTYSNRAKTERLGVSEALLAAHGAVSRETAEAMAQGAAERTGARRALSVTGIAGPGGGSAEKPVGLVWFGLCADGEVSSHERHFPARGREFVRDLAANTGLWLLHRSLA
jgi:nicotinamide-nucleotide amidase